MGRKIASLLRTMILCYLFSFLLLSLAAVLLWKLQLSAGQMQPGIYAVYGLSCLPGGFLCGRIFQDRRILWGAVFGICYFAILLLLSVILTHTVLTISAGLLISLGVCVLGGFLGALAS